MALGEINYFVLPVITTWFALLTEQPRVSVVNKIIELSPKFVPLFFLKNHFGS